MKNTLTYGLPVFVSFSLLASAALAAGPDRDIPCESKDQAPVTCSTGYSNARVLFVRETSPEQGRCLEGYTYSVARDGSSVQVSGGCQATFRVQPRVFQFECASQDYKKTGCPLGVPVSSVRLVQQLSKPNWMGRGACKEGSTWFLDGNVIVADNGCRAIFEVVRLYPEEVTDPGAETYLPFEFKDSSLYNRGDIAKHVADLKVRKSALTSRGYSTVELDDMKLTFFSPVLQALESITQPSDGRRAPNWAESGCATHAAFDPAASLRLNDTSSACISARDEIARRLDGFQKDCRRAAEPESFVEEQAPGEPSTGLLSSIEGEISLSFEALRHIQFPGNLVNADMIMRLRPIIAKIRHDKILDQNIKPRQAQYVTARQIYSSNVNCFAGNAGEFLGVMSTLERELEDQRGYLDRLAEAGRAQAKADLRAIQAQGRNRDSLPYDSLTDDDRRYISMVLGGIYWRMRGGGLVSKPDGTQMTRIYYTLLPMTALAELNGGSGVKDLGTDLYTRIFKGWGDYMDMGTTPDGRDRFYDLTFMTERGVYQVEGAVGTLGDKGYDTTDLRAGGMQMGPCYYYAMKKLMQVRAGDNLQPPYGAFIDGFTSWGEVCTGAVISLGMAESLLKGRR